MPNVSVVLQYSVALQGHNAFSLISPARRQVGRRSVSLRHFRDVPPL